MKILYFILVISYGGGGSKVNLTLGRGGLKNGDDLTIFNLSASLSDKFKLLNCHH